MKVWFTQHVGHANAEQVQDGVLADGVVYQARNLPVTAVEVALPCLVGVADGVSGGPLARLSSQLVLKLLQSFAHNAPETLEDGLIGARTVNKVAEVFRGKLASHRTWGAASTLAALHVGDGRAAVVNCGDSRVYRFRRNGECRLLSKDHTVLNDLRAVGRVKDGAYASIYNGLSSCIIADPEEADVRISRWVEETAEGDVFVLATDGVHDALGDNGFRQLFDPGLPLPQMVERWRQGVLDAGSPDNFTIAVLEA